MELYDALGRAYPGWNLGDIRGLTPREREFFLSRATERLTKGRS